MQWLDYGNGKYCWLSPTITKHSRLSLFNIHQPKYTCTVSIGYKVGMVRLETRERERYSGIERIKRWHCMKSGRMHWRRTVKLIK